MDDERLIILRLVQSGKVTAEEAAALLDALGSDSPSPKAQLEQSETASATQADRNPAPDLTSRVANKSGFEWSAWEGFARLFTGSGPGIEVTETITGDLPTVDHTKVALETKNGYITVKPWEGPGYKLVAVKRVRAGSEEEAGQLAADALEVVVDSDHLQVTTNENNTVMSVAITAYLPAGRTYEFDVETKNGQLNLHNMQCSQCRMETTNGGISINNLTVDDLSAESTNGGIRIENVQAKSVQAETTNGGIKWHGAAYSVRLETTNGSIKAHPKTIQASDNNIQPERAVYDLESCNGSIDVDLADVCAEVELQAETTHGKIHVPDQMHITHQRNPIGSRELRGVLAGTSGEHIALTIETAHGSISVRRAK